MILLLLKILKLLEIMNTYFSICVNKNSPQVGHEIEYVLDVTQIIAKHEDHPSITKIKENVIYDNNFSFALNSLDGITICINQLNSMKPTTYNNIPAKIIKEFSDVCSNHIHKLYNESILQG